MTTESIIEINVGGRLFQTTVFTLTKYSGLMLSAMFSYTDTAGTYLQPHYGNGVFGNVYLSAGLHWEVNIAGTPLP